MFFVDASGDKLTFAWNDKEKYTVSSVPEVIVADVPFNAFLEAVKAVPQSKLIFLLREDGMRAYNLGAGWAQSKFGFPVDKIGKLPVPGRGELDLKLFGKLLGVLPGPPPPRNPPPVPASPPTKPAPAPTPVPAPASMPPKQNPSAPSAPNPAPAPVPAPAAPKP